MIFAADAAGGMLTNRMTASFILCVNRDNPWLDTAIESVLAQDEPAFEFLIGANACDDALWEKLNAYAARDTRISLTRTAIGQLAFNLNILADKARGDYLVRMDADDVCMPHRLSTLMSVLSVDPVDILGSAVTLINEAGVPIGRMDFPLTSDAIVKALPTRTVFCHPAVAVKRQFLLGMRGYLGGFVSEDTDLWLRAQRAGASMKNLPDALLSYRLHGNQSIMSSAGYAEVASHWLREWVIDPSWYHFRGLTIACMKALLARRLPGVRRYLSKRNSRGLNR
ncbi:glycosyltransferase [Rhizobium sp. 18055]|uniref:glycosyltransferase n=1 Tax=Rhizobium sp. 18055 TaxID=2681403 RepID=UPI00135804A2|nr:glycosyltransferase [Rhizobium sp. 18055]